MNQPDQFEAWFELTFPRDEDGHRRQYKQAMVMDLMRMAWHGSRDAAIEEAAKMLDLLWDGYTPKDCAEAIRALAQREEGK